MVIPLTTTNENILSLHQHIIHVPHEVIAKILVVIVAIALVGIATSIILYYAGVGAVKADILIERFELKKRQGIFTIRNVSNIKILRVEKLLVECSSKTLELDRGLIPLSILSGGSVTSVFNIDVDDGDQCRLYIEAEGEGGCRVAVSSALIPVRSI